MGNRPEGLIGKTDGERGEGEGGGDEEEEVGEGE
jgi:hypothetical protein